MATKWCEKCSIEFEFYYGFYEIHNDTTIMPMHYELKKCPHCGSELITMEKKVR